MKKLPEQIIIEIENVEMVFKNLLEAKARKERTVVELSALGTFLHNIYNGIENILKQALLIKNIRIAKSASWHKDLLNRSVAEGIISQELAARLYEYLTFRHFFIHGYGFMLDAPSIEKLSENIQNIWKQFLSELESYYA